VREFGQQTTSAGDAKTLPVALYILTRDLNISFVNTTSRAEAEMKQYGLRGAVYLELMLKVKRIARLFKFLLCCCTRRYLLDRHLASASSMPSNIIFLHPVSVWSR